MTLEELQRISVESCHEHIGSPVCAVLRDGTHIYGILGGVEDGKIKLHRAVRGPGKLSVSAAKAKRAIRPRTKAFGAPFVGDPFLVDTALIALLFALPFFFV